MAPRRDDVTALELVGGPEALTHPLSDYDPAWAGRYLEHQRLIGEALGTVDVVHVHLYERGAPAIDEYLLLRDHLRSNADDRALYERTKRRLMSRQWNDMNDYADAKTDVIAAIKERARMASGL
ncbi:GrpB family protein [Agreia sp. PsM10]|uniref:GrpB family protein n=1 Tax=Agreia sp. PsM10 TaxID=3030533 RepID=UPI00263B3DE0|nr:GrpB family protein [Agreia sp. PsM10]MDN4639160.1 GrpB family protein [Agreia sp. PsM10]